MSVSLDKITDVVVHPDHTGMAYRGVPTLITPTRVTVKITKAWGTLTGVDHTWAVRGCVVVFPRTACDLYRAN